MLSYLESVKWFIRDHFKGVCSEPASQRHLHSHQLPMTPKKIYIFPTYVFVTAFCKITKQNKNKGKTQRAKTDVTSFSLAPSPWKCQSRALYLSFKSAVPFATSKTTPHLEESECPGISLIAFPTIDMEDGTELDKQASLWEEKTVIRQKENNWKNQWFSIFIHSLRCFFFFFLKSKAVYDHTLRF